MVLSFEEDLFILSDTVSHFSFSSFIKKSGGWFFFSFSLSNIPLEFLLHVVRPYTPSFSNRSVASITLANMLIRFFHSFQLINHHCVLFFRSQRLLLLLLLFTLLAYTLLLRFINKQKKLAQGEGGPEGRVAGRSEDARIGVFFF